jgi:bacterioferritin-associated ferredoxin
VVICHCLAVNDRAVATAIAAGAREPEDLASICGAGSRCGGCLPALRDLLESHSVTTVDRVCQPAA